MLLHGCAPGERSSDGIWKFRTSSLKCYVDHWHTMYSSGNIDVQNWVHLFESRCIITTIFLKDVPRVCLLISLQQLTNTTVSCGGVQQQAQKRNSNHRTFWVAPVQYPSPAFQLYAYHSTARVSVSTGVVTACRLWSTAEHFFVHHLFEVIPCFAYNSLRSGRRSCGTLLSIPTSKREYFCWRARCRLEWLEKVYTALNP